MSLHPRFLLVLSLLAALHAWIGWRILPDATAAPLWQVAGGLWLATSFLLIPLGLFATRIRRQPLSDRLSWAGMMAMGMFSSLLLLSLVRELVLLLAPFIGVNDAALPVWSARAVLLLTAGLTVLGFFNARRLAQVVEVDVPIANLPPGLEGFTIAQISDIHVGPTIKHDYLLRIVNRVNSLEADVIAVTGDLVDGSVSRLSRHTAALAQLKARYGIFFVTGNHEYYSNAHAWIAEIRRLRLTVLLNQHVVLAHRGSNLLLAGVTDYSAEHFDPSHRSDPHAALRGAPANVDLKVLLAHQPRSAIAAADAGFDVQISGHTHGGQFFPWNLFVPLQQPFTAGLNKFRQLWVYTSRGTGYWGPPKRLWAPSEITRLRLVRA